MSPDSTWYRRNIVGHWRMLLSILAVVLLANAAWIYRYITMPGPYAPLGPYSVQTVGLPKESYPLPSGASGSATRAQVLPTLHIHPGVHPPLVPVAATKCSMAPDVIVIAGVSRWREVEPPGFFSPDVHGQTERLPGCSQFNYQDDVPAEVIARVEALAATGQTTTVWQIQGQETPVNHTNAATIYWQSENLAIVVSV